MYYVSLAARNLTRPLVLSLLMIAAIGVGIGASMTVLAIFRAMSGDPIPDKSHQLWVPQLDNWGPGKRVASGSLHADGLPDQLSYIDAGALLHAQGPSRQAAMYRTQLTLIPGNPQLPPRLVDVRATYTDFFPMFDAPMMYGAPWSASEDEGRAAVVVITRELNDRLFNGTNSVGQTITLGNEAYRIAGVLRDWRPTPRFYDLHGDRFGDTEEVFLPFTRAVEQKMPQTGEVSCNGDHEDTRDRTRLLQSDCVWIQYWVELPNEAAVRAYRAFLDNYAAAQRVAGRFAWPPHTELRDVRQWLIYQHVVSGEMQVMVMVAFSFLFVCLLNAMGLMLARTMSRRADVATRRALGATRQAIFSQCLVEAGVIGAAGGLVGLLLTALGLAGVRELFAGESGVLALTRVDLADVAIALLLAIVATVVAGLYPTWRAVQVHPASELKAQ